MNKFIKWLSQPNYFWMTLMQVLLPVYIYLAVASDAEWTWWLGSIVFYFLYLAIGNNIGMHRYYCHRYFTMNRPTEWFVAWCAMMGCMGSPICYAGIHQVHHRLHDTEQDPHGLARGWKSVLYYYHRQIDQKEIKFSRSIADLTKRYGLVHQFYWPFVFANAAIFYLISWKALLFLWLIPASLTLWAVALVLLMQHDQDGPNNSRAYMWFGWGETWHKNHHLDQSLTDHSLGKGIDWTYQLSKLLANESNTNKKD